MLLLLFIASVNFEDKVAPVLIERCVQCHNSVKPMGAVRLTTGTAASRVVVPGQPDKSKLYLAIESGSMPPNGSLPKEQKDAIRDWILEGAKWPAGMNLESTRLPAVERATVTRIRDQIVANKAAPPTNMVPIPSGDFVMGSTNRKD